MPVEGAAEEVKAEVQEGNGKSSGAGRDGKSAEVLIAEIQNQLGKFSMEYLLRIMVTQSDEVGKEKGFNEKIILQLGGLSHLARTMNLLSFTPFALIAITS